jgi:hypothetical protein
VLTGAEKELARMKGSLVISLTRGSKKIKADRAVAIAEGAKIKSKRTVEDLQMDIKDLKRSRENMLDMSPNDSTSLVIAKEFNPDKFILEYNDLGLQVRNKEIQLEIALASHLELFGEELKEGS